MTPRPYFCDKTAKEVLTDPDDAYWTTHQSLKAMGLTEQAAIAGAQQACHETAEGSAESNRNMAGMAMLRAEGGKWVFTHGTGRAHKFIGKTLDDVAKSDLWFLKFLVSPKCGISKEDKKIIRRRLGATPQKPFGFT